MNNTHLLDVQTMHLYGLSTMIFDFLTLVVVLFIIKEMKK